MSTLIPELIFLKMMQYHLTILTQALTKSFKTLTIVLIYRIHTYLTHMTAEGEKGIFNSTFFQYYRIFDVIFSSALQIKPKLLSLIFNAFTGSQLKTTAPDFKLTI